MIRETTCDNLGNNYNKGESTLGCQNFDRIESLFKVLF